MRGVVGRRQLDQTGCGEATAKQIDRFAVAGGKHRPPPNRSASFDRRRAVRAPLTAMGRAGINDFRVNATGHTRGRKQRSRTLWCWRSSTDMPSGTATYQESFLAQR
jgi:hypothetical protein